MAEKTSVEIVIEAQDHASGVLRQVDTAQRNLAQGTQQLAGASATLSTQQQKTATTTGQLTNSQQGLKNMMGQLLQNTEALKVAQQQMVAVMQTANQALVDMAGPLGGVASGFASVFAAMGPVGIGFAALTLATVGLGVAWVELALHAAEYQRNIDVISERTGLTTREIVGLKEAAAASGKTFDEIAPALNIFTRKLGEAARGDEAAVQAFRNVGVSVKDMNGEIRPTGEVLQDVGRWMADTESKSERMAAAFDLFGRGAGRSLEVFTRDMKEMQAAAERRGSILNPDTEEQLRRLHEQFLNISLSIEALKLQLMAMAGVTLQPVIAQVSNLITWLQKLGSDERVKAAISFMQWLDRPFWQKTPNVQVGHAPQPDATQGGLSSITPMIPPEMAQDMAIEAERRNREMLEKEYNDTVKRAASDRKDAEAAWKAAMEKPMQGLPANWFQQSQEHPFSFEGLSKDRLKDIPGGQLKDPEVTFNKAERELIDTAQAMGLTVEQAGAMNQAILGLSAGLQEANVSAIQFGKSVSQMVIGTFHETVLNFIKGTANVGAAFHELIQRMIAEIAFKTAIGIIGSLIPGASAFNPATVSTGGIIHGAMGVPPRLWGKDSIAAVLQPNERVLSVRRNDEFEGLLTSLSQMLTSQPRQASSMPDNVTYNITMPISGAFIDRNALRNFAEEQLVPLISSLQERRAVRRGY